MTASKSTTEKPSPFKKFLSTHPKALEFVTTPKPIPVRFATESFFAVSAVTFLNNEGLSTFGRVRIKPVAPSEYLDEISAATKPPNFLFDEIKVRLSSRPIFFQIFIQIAEEGDLVDDSTVRCPDTRKEIFFGTITLTKAIPDSDLPGNSNYLRSDSSG